MGMISNLIFLTILVVGTLTPLARTLEEPPITVTQGMESGIERWKEEAKEGQAEPKIQALDTDVVVLGCGTFTALKFSVSVCFESPFQVLGGSPTEAEEVRFRVVDRVAREVDAPGVDEGKEVGHACGGDVFSLRFVESLSGASFAPISIFHVPPEEDPHPERGCLYGATIHTPPQNGVYALELYLVHVNHEGDAEPSEEEMASLKYPANVGGMPEIRMGGPQFYNIPWEAIPDSGVPLGYLAVRGFVEDASTWIMRDFGDPVCATLREEGRGDRPEERFGWWLSPRDAMTSPFTRFRVEFYTHSGCPIPHYSARQMRKCLDDHALAVYGESIGVQTLQYIVQSALAVNTSHVEGSVAHTHYGRYDFHPSIATKPDTLFTQADSVFMSPHNPFRLMTLEECHGLTVLLELRMVGESPWEKLPGTIPDTIVVAQGANDAMRESSDVWAANWEAFADRLDKLGWNGTLVLVSAPIRRYKSGGTEGDGTCLGAISRKPPLFRFVTKNLPSMSKWDALSGIDGSAADSRPGDLMSPLGRATVVPSNEVRVVIELPHGIPMFYNTFSRVKAFNKLSLDFVKSRFAGRYRYVDYEPLSEGATPSACVDGVHFCYFTSKLWGTVTNRHFSEACEVTSAIAHAQVTALCPSLPYLSHPSPFH